MKEKNSEQKGFCSEFSLMEKKKNSEHKELCSYMSFQTLSFQT